jgi:IS5 family transposase
MPANAILTAVGYNFRLVLAWLRQLLLLILAALLNLHEGQPAFKSAS